ncbi:hypothetical protein JYU34_007205, partial [Plutella xylostella]
HQSCVLLRRSVERRAPRGVGLVVMRARRPSASQYPRGRRPDTTPHALRASRATSRQHDVTSRAR